MLTAIVSLNEVMNVNIAFCAATKLNNLICIYFFITSFIICDFSEKCGKVKKNWQLNTKKVEIHHQKASYTNKMVPLIKTGTGIVPLIMYFNKIGKNPFKSSIISLESINMYL